ncbi:hypothetical protein Pmani_035766 [Petrolisthes manimaculis]|uniref:Uncharacterized protein n=1 Tax=Petrolisthes manimaculis TaxID=1843537 RepID=A0AAE1NKZ5_9EUCA|nr:hypothetical protein Pmani_035766 [Petrolisthes manimaculis]
MEEKDDKEEEKENEKEEKDDKEEEKENEKEEKDDKEEEKENEKEEKGRGTIYVSRSTDEFKKIHTIRTGETN